MPGAGFPAYPAFVLRFGGYDLDGDELFGIISQADVARELAHSQTGEWGAQEHTRMR